jgi:hypothetical protein
VVWGQAMVGTGMSGSKRRMLSAAVAVSLVASTCVARADDAGVYSFFQGMFGGGQSEPSAQPLPQPDYAYPEPEGHPLTVRRQRHRRPAAPRQARAVKSPRDTVADLKGVTIYTDRTLEPGDAVMTDKGLRVFAGSDAWPYRDADFVAIADVKRIAPDRRKLLQSIDVASRVDLAR